jgi:hypothetical protein
MIIMMIAVVIVRLRPPDLFVGPQLVSVITQKPVLGRIKHALLIYISPIRSHVEIVLDLLVRLGFVHLGSSNAKCREMEYLRMDFVQVTIMFNIIYSFFY